MNCPACNGTGLAVVQRGAHGWEMLKKCPAGCYDLLPPPDPKTFDWLRPMGMDEYQTPAGPVEHAPSFIEYQEQAARIGARQP